MPSQCESYSLIPVARKLTLSPSSNRVKSLFQIFEDGPLEFVLPILEGYIAEKDNRHKQRAAGELIGG